MTSIKLNNEHEISLCAECCSAKIDQISIDKVCRYGIPTDVAVILAVDVYPKDLFNTEMCNEIERSF